MEDVDLLFRLARREVEDDDGERPLPSLETLNRLPTREVFERAAALVNDDDATSRELGLRVLRQLGDDQPFGAETVPLLLDRLRDETEPDVLRWVISALGYHRATTALPQVVALAGHPDEWIRFHVAAALPSLVDLDHVEPAAADALIRLCHDEDSQIRYYALYAATREIPGMDVETVTRMTERLAADPDELIRTMAVNHTEAVREARKLLGPHEHLVGPVLVTLDWAADAGPLDEELRRHLGAATPPHLAEQLFAWWKRRQAYL